MALTLTLTWSWSPSQAAFYPNELRAHYDAAGTWPKDATAVSADIYAAANPAMFDGKRLAADANGQPIRVAPTPPETVASPS